MNSFWKNLVLIIADIIICIFIFYLLLFAFVYLNEAIIPDSFRIRNGTLRQVLPQWYIAAIIILFIELIIILYPVYVFHKWYLEDATNFSHKPLYITTLMGIFSFSGLLYFIFFR